MVVLDFPAPIAPPALNKRQCLSVQRSTMDEVRLPELFAQPLVTPQNGVVALAGVGKVTENGYRRVPAQKELARQFLSTLTAAT